MDYHLESNQRAWDRKAKAQGWYVDSARDEDFRAPLRVADPQGWLGDDVAGWKILCLAAGGGRHGPLLAAAGAIVTVLDLSPEMLALDRAMANSRGLALDLFAGTMEDLSLFVPAHFDAVVQPVSTCYVPKVAPVFAEVARVLRAGGLYLSHHKQPASLQASAEAEPRSGRFQLLEPYYREGPLPPAPRDSYHRENDATEFLHTWEELLGGLCRQGFVIEDFHEPKRGDPEAPPGSFAYRSAFLPPFVSLKARRA